MSELLSALNEHYLHHGSYPRVILDSAYFQDLEDEPYFEIMKLVDDGIKVDIGHLETEDWRIE